MKTRTSNTLSKGQTIAFILFISLFGFITTSSGQVEEAKKWNYSVGVGMATTPSYLGDDEYQLLLFPNFRVTYSDKFFASLLEGIGYNVIKTNTWRMGPIVKTHIGRFEDGTVPSSISGNKTEDLLGLGDVGFTLETGGFIEYTKGFISTKLEIRQGIGGHQGMIGELKSEIKSSFRIRKKSIYYALGPEIRITDSRFNNAFFGINQDQSSTSDFEVYDAKFGLLSYGLSGSFLIPINKKLSTIGFLRYSRLGDVASDSQLVSQNGSVHQTTVGLMLNYSF